MIKLPATITGIRTTSDGGVSLTLHSQELTPAQKLEVMEMHNMFGWLLFKENAFIESDIPKEQADIDNQKTPSKRIRAVLYRIWEQLGKQGDFETYYRQQTEKIIEFLKSKLD